MRIDYDSPIVPAGSFTWGEYAWLKGFGRYAVPTQQQYANAIELFGFLQPLRDALGLPLLITSGARSDEYTLYLRKKGIQAAKYSAHNQWRAVDLVCPKLPYKELYQFLSQRWQGRMELLRYTPGWVHIDTLSWGEKIRFIP